MIWSEDEHKPHSSAVLSGCNVLPNFLRLFSNVTSPKRPSATVPLTFCIHHPALFFFIGFYVTFVQISLSSASSLRE